MGGRRAPVRRPPAAAPGALHRLRDLRERARNYRSPGVDHILDESGLRAAAAAFRPRWQARQPRKIAALAAPLPRTHLREFADHLGERLHKPEREAKSPLGEPDDEVVRVSTIHGAKGLEWPVVILAGLHTPRRGGRNDDPVLADAAGFAARAGDAVTPLWAFLENRRRRRAEAEDVRLFYVACTRAREALVLSRAGPGEGTYLPLVPAGTFPDVEAPTTGAPKASLPRQAPLPAEAEIDSWTERRGEYEEAMRKPAVITPTGLMHRDDDADLEHGHSFDSPPPRTPASSSLRPRTAAELRRRRPRPRPRAPPPPRLPAPNAPKPSPRRRTPPGHS